MRWGRTDMTNFANFSILFVGILSSLQFFIPLFGKKIDKKTLNYLISSISTTCFVFLSISLMILILAYVKSDFSLLNVWSNSHTSKPLIYKISGSWGNHEGSMLLWCWVMSLYGFFVTLNFQRISSDFKTKILMFQGILCFGFIVFLKFKSNPFEKLFPIPEEGIGLNPLLQDPGLAFHPPFLYLGYVGLSIVWSFALAGLFNESFDKDWATKTKPWVIVSWIFLSIGITLGSYWAYYELGWGGFWFWDPVENASLIPWIVATALMHSIIVMEKRGILVNWCILLSILGFALSMVGTFIVRSGLLTSVHAFANDPDRGLFILSLIAIYIIGSLFVFAIKPIKTDQLAKYNLLSKDFFLIINNLLLIVSALTIFIGTIYPMILEIFSGDRISVGPPFYTITVIPIIFLFSILASIAIFLPWGKLKTNFKYAKILILFLLSLFLTLIFYIYFDVQNIFSNIGVFVSFWILLSSVYGLINRRKKISLSSFFGHSGLGILILGCSISISSQKQYEGPMSLNENLKIGDYKVRFLSVEDGNGPNYINSTGNFSLEGAGRIIKLSAEKRFYPVEKSMTTEAGIYSKYFSHVYIILGEKINSDEWMVRIWFKPLVSLIWIGALIASLGGLLSLLDKIIFKPNFRYLVFLFIFLFSYPINSYSDNISIYESELIESRIKSINQNIRCLVCESQTIDESNSPLAKDLREIVREKVLNNETDENIYNYFRERYGDYIIMKPPFKNNTLLLWIAPFVFIIMGLFIIFKYQKKHTGN